MNAGRFTVDTAHVLSDTLSTNQPLTLTFKLLAFTFRKKNHVYSLHIMILYLCFVLLQVIVTTPMEMLKIQLQDAGRLGKRKLNPDGGLGKNEVHGGKLEEQWPHVAMLEITTALFQLLLMLKIQNVCPHTCYYHPVIIAIAFK